MNDAQDTAALIDDIFSVNDGSFDELAIRVFRKQYAENELYRRFCELNKVAVDQVQHLTEIPYLPISFFKTSTIIAAGRTAETVFESSGTTGSVNSKHHVTDLALYARSFLTSFEHVYGDVKGKCILGLLPSYLERGNSSLVYMVKELIDLSGNARSGFYLDDLEKLAATLRQNEEEHTETILFGVTYALLDFSQQNPMPLKHTTIIETGGMKGRREELTRREVHAVLKKQFRLRVIHSEYGMTELLSQAYSTGEGIFVSPPWMKILLREEDDPRAVRAGTPAGQAFFHGAINIIDLANLHSCAFIATDDIGKLYSNGSFEVSGRLDNSDIRGCSLLAI